uniref:Uncharacterized protein n=1 Tax=Siphoviridae sp. ctf8W5 TaxID=2825595 RepID=A0A8S5Q824_9CAUD|nr:MAG TPA: hypothetical protein [Siphoviridae sp. ctf8W5]
MLGVGQYSNGSLNFSFYTGTIITGRDNVYSMTAAKPPAGQ